VVDALGALTEQQRSQISGWPVVYEVFEKELKDEALPAPGDPNHQLIQNFMGYLQVAQGQTSKSKDKEKIAELNSVLVQKGFTASEAHSPIALGVPISGAGTPPPPTQAAWWSFGWGSSGHAAKSPARVVDEQ
jgi:hypothetical protein